MFLSENVAQQLSLNSQYYINSLTLSPAFSGLNRNTELFLSYYQQWVGIEGAPVCGNIYFSTPLSDKMGLGVSVLSEQTGNLQHFYFDASWAYHLSFGNGGLSFGIAPKIYRNQLDLSKIKTQGADPLLQNQEVFLGTTFDAGAGILFYWANLSLGVAAPRLMASQLSYNSENSSKFTLSRHFLIHLSYEYSKKEKDLKVFSITPSVVLRKSTNSALFYEAILTAEYRERLWLGLGYRKNNLMFSAGAALTDRIALNYTYEYGLSSSISGSSSGSHEVTIGFLLKTSKNRKFSSAFPPPEEKQRDRDSAVSNPTLPPDFTRKFNDLKDKVEKFNTELAKRDKEIKNLDARLKEYETANRKADALYDAAFIIQNIKFASGSEKLSSSSFPELDKLVRKMQEDSRKEIKITGHTDNVGGSAYNKNLSGRRAKSVAAYLISKGIAASRIVTEGKGDETPIADNNTPEGRAQNRRIEGAWKK